MNLSDVNSIAMFEVFQSCFNTLLKYIHKGIIWYQKAHSYLFSFYVSSCTYEILVYIFKPHKNLNEVYYLPNLPQDICMNNILFHSKLVKKILCQIHYTHFFVILYSVTSHHNFIIIK